MAGLIDKIRLAFFPPQEVPPDLQSLQSFYAGSDDLVQDHFDAALLDDLRTLVGAKNSSGEDWSW